MIPDYKNIFAGIFYPGSSAQQVTAILRDFRKLMDVSKQELAHSSHISPQTLSNIEEGRTLNPTFNSLAKIAEGLGLCFVIDTSANMMRRQSGIVRLDDSPFAIYGDNANPIEGLSHLLNIVRKEGKLNLKKVSEITRIENKILMKMFNSHNVWIDSTLDLISYFDFSLSLESRNYHKIWDKIGKNPKMIPNKYNTSESTIKAVGQSVAANIHKPTIKKEDGTHLVFPSHKGSNGIAL